MLSRRRFLTIAAASLATPAMAMPIREWRCVAMGAEVTILLAGHDGTADVRLYPRIETLLRRVESHFSLHRDSSLTRLNRDGRLAYPPPQMLEVFDLATRVHEATDGVFDPSIQPLWRAIALGKDTEAVRCHVGWRRISVAPSEIALKPGMALTFNGIAQGYAADCAVSLLKAQGYRNVLVDTGEIATIGGRGPGESWRAAIADPENRVIGRSLLEDRALATSSPRGTLIGGGQPHIIGPGGQAPRWQTVSVSATRAALADALSTAFCLMDREAIEAALAQFPGARIEALV